MVALHRFGCRARALEVYQRLRSSMVSELGLKPSPRLQRLHSAVLAAAATLDDLPASVGVGHASQDRWSPSGLVTAGSGGHVRYPGL